MNINLSFPLCQEIDGELYIHAVTIIVALIVLQALQLLFRPVWYRIKRLLRLLWRVVRSKFM